MKQARAWRWAAAILTLGWMNQAIGQSAEDFYRGRQARVIIHSAAGGDYDQWARLVTRHMGKYIPGNPTFVPQNMPGAGGIIAANHLFNTAPRDGSVIGIIGRNLPYQALMKEEGVRFDPLKFNWLGSPELTNRICIVNDNAPVTNARDLFTKELLMGGAGAGTAVSTVPQLLSNLLGMKLKLIEGYGSSVNVQLAMERGEVHGVCQSLSTLRNARPGWLESGKWKVLFNMERARAPGLDAPSVHEFAKTEEQRQILTIFSSSVEFGRPFVAPPDVPAERVAVLRKAFESALQDPALQEDAKKLGLDIALVRGEDLAELIRDMMKTPPEIAKKMQELTK
jgi:tripartite-type tricarboxylate transporter receptor subunit TctC